MENNKRKSRLDEPAGRTMACQSIERINNAIDKYERGKYDEQGFHATIESVIQSILESDLSDLRNFLIDMEERLEHINFMISKSNRRDEYLKVISLIKVRLLKADN